MMKEEEESTTPVYKAKYIPPLLHVIEVEMEYGIAAGSAQTVSPDLNGKVKDEWETAPNDDRPVEWL
ncbi:hypothetical protein DSC47_11890 [Elizabethkingia miricola]|nr:hypothetical protein DSC47_11890 [Elizabethkingia miricola]